MDEHDTSDIRSGHSTIAATRRLVTASNQSSYHVGAGIVERIPIQGAGIGRARLPPVPLSTIVSSRYIPISRISTHPSVGSSSPLYAVKRPMPQDYITDLQLMRKFPRSTDKSKGLRHFSTKVCEKVKEKGHTNYNEVADELVSEYFDSADVQPTDTEKQQYDMKNIRRRVYDALNVLMAMNIIEKEKKEIRWVGLPTSSLQECRKLEEEKIKRQERIRHKCDQLQELIIQLVAYKTLVEKNRELERDNGRPREESVLYLPFIIINTEKKTFIDCAISHDKTEYLFNFDLPFEIHDDIEVLKRLGLAYGMERGEVKDEDREKIKSMLPVSLRDYVDHIIDGTLNNFYDISSNVSTATATTSQEKQTVYAQIPRYYNPAQALRQATVGISSTPPPPQKRPMPTILPSVLPRSLPANPSSIVRGGDANYVPTSTIEYRAVRTSGHHYGVQQQGPSNAEQRGYNTSKVAYTIQEPKESRLPEERYDEPFEEGENFGFEQ